MRVRFTVVIEGSGPSVAKAYQDMRRKLLPIRNWSDTDGAIMVKPDGEQVPLEEELVQAARKLFKTSKDGERRCNGDASCLHDVVVYGIPACMMDSKEARKMVKRGRKIQAGMDKSS